MTESEVLLHAAAAVLLLCLAYHHPGWSRRLGRGGFAVMICGALVPVLDLLLFYVRAGDRIDFLTQDPFFSAPFYGALLIGAAAFLVAFVAGTGFAARLFVLLAAGYLLHLALAALTPVGASLLYPFLPGRHGLSLFYAGHSLLVGLLVVILLLLEGLPRFRRLTAGAAMLLLGVYVLAGAGQFIFVTVSARHLTPPGARLSVQPATPWLHRWLVTVTEPRTYRVRRHGIDMGTFEAPEDLERWNDEGLMTHLLGDPTVARFYHQVFRHPVARLESTDLRVTLIMQEAGDLAPPVPGRTFYFEVDHEGRNRFYQVQRFD
jgi:hypothetical protein